MLNIRKSSERGGVNHGWLNTKHTFSFADYHDPEFMGYGPLRVINEDWIGAGQGFGKHPHRDMEIVTYVLSGALEHEDSMGNKEVIKAGDLQRMTAGRGILHSEYNHSKTDDVHLLQIWIMPEQNRLTPGYEQKDGSALNKRNELQCVVSHEPTNGELKIHQDANIFVGKLDAGTNVAHGFGNGRLGWIQVIEGSVSVGDQELSAGDGAAIEKEKLLQIAAQTDTHFLLFDMAA